MSIPIYKNFTRIQDRVHKKEEAERKKRVWGDDKRLPSVFKVFFLVCVLPLFLPGIVNLPDW